MATKKRCAKCGWKKDGGIKFGNLLRDNNSRYRRYTACIGCRLRKSMGLKYPKKEHPHNEMELSPKWCPECGLNTYWEVRLAKLLEANYAGCIGCDLLEVLTFENQKEDESPPSMRCPECKSKKVQQISICHLHGKQLAESETSVSTDVDSVCTECDSLTVEGWKCQKCGYSNQSEQDFVMPPTCPECNSKKVVLTLYGYPTPDTFEKYEERDPNIWPRYELGGCCVMNEETSRCERCGYKW